MLMQVDISGVAALVCRHQAPIFMVNIKAGEKMCYADLMLSRLLLRERLVARHVWYDIGCRYGPHWRSFLGHWLATLPPALRATATAHLQLLGDEGVRFPLPPFHVHCHRWVMDVLPWWRDAGEGEGQVASSVWTACCPAVPHSAVHQLPSFITILHTPGLFDAVPPLACWLPLQPAMPREAFQRTHAGSWHGARGAARAAVV
jgi:hypothetical protein